MNYRFFFLYLLAVGFSSNAAQAQSIYDSVTVMRTVILDGDTLPVFVFEPVSIYSPRTFRNKREKAKYNKLERYVVRVYPYAEVAGEMLQDFDDTLKSFTSERKRKKYLEKVEEELKEEFSGELKKLTIKQGIILVKLIDRETGNTSYDLIKSLRGSFSAFIWQSLARLFGSNLKLEYDEVGEDEMIEDIVRRIESGEIPYTKRKRKL